jgi:hypothetical protein
MNVAIILRSCIAAKARTLYQRKRVEDAQTHNKRLEVTNCKIGIDETKFIMS